MYKLALMDNARVRPSVLTPAQVQVSTGYRTILPSKPVIVGDQVYVPDMKGHEMMHQGKFPTDVGRGWMSSILGRNRSMLPVGKDQTVVSNPLPYENN
jgi:hypothetical protein